MITPSQDDLSERKWEHMPQNVSGDHLWMERWWEILIFSFFLVSKSSKNEQCITSVKKRNVIIITNAPKRFHSWGKCFIWKPPRVGAGEASPSACVKMWALTAVCVAPSKLLQGTQGGTKRNLSFQVLTMQYVKKHCKVKSVVCPKGGAFFFFFFKVPYEFRREEETPDRHSYPFLRAGQEFLLGCFQELHDRSQLCYTLDQIFFVF